MRKLINMNIFKIKRCSNCFYDGDYKCDLPYFEKCIDFCIEAEKIRAKNYYEQHNVAADWWSNIKKSNSLDKE